MNNDQANKWNQNDERRDTSGKDSSNDNSDNINKNKSGGDGHKSPPHVVPVLSQFERDVLAKQNARGRGDVEGEGGFAVEGGAVAVPAQPQQQQQQQQQQHQHSLAQLEQDVLAKQNARPSGGGGIETVRTTSLSQMERDVLAKQNARGGVGAGGGGGGDSVGAAVTRPGAFAYTPSNSTNVDSKNNATATNLSRVEQDVLAKEAARQQVILGNAGGGGVPGVVHHTSNNNNTNNLSQLEQDVLAKQNARGGSAVVGAVAVSGYGGATNIPTNTTTTTNNASSSNHNTNTLSQLEMDVMAKQNARAANTGNVTKPGAVPSIATSSNSSPSNSTLSQLERDILIKQNARGGATQPGAVPVSPVPVGSSVSTSLTQLEQDIALKSHGRNTIETSQPDAYSSPSAVAGTTSTTGSNNNVSTSLNQLEQDIASKVHASGNIGAGAIRASQPGAVSYVSNEGAARTVAGTAAGLTQLEQDIAAKARASQQLSGGVAVAASSSSNPASALSQLERDIQTKAAASIGVGGGGAPGAYGTSGGSNLHQLEQDLVAKSRVGSVTTGTSQPGAISSTTALSQLEHDVLSKTRQHQQQSTPGVGIVYGAKAPPPTTNTNRLSQMEADIMAKNQVRALASSQQQQPASSLEQFERDVAMKNSAAAGIVISEAATAPGVSAALYRTQDEILAKSRGSSQQPLVSPTTGAGAASSTSGLAASLYQMEDNLLAKHRISAPSDPSDPPGMYPVHGNNIYQPTQQYGYNSALPPSYPETEMQVISSQSPPSDPYFIGQRQQEHYYDGIEVIQDAPVTAAVTVADPEAPLYAGSTIVAGTSTDVSTETAGIEAFVADNVVDATGVAVIMSDEEEEIMEKKRQRRFMGYGILCVIITLIAIIVPITISGSSDPKATKTLAPTSAPTMAPTLGPTSQVIPDIVNTLSKYSTVEALTDRKSPQYHALEWLVTKDQYVKSLNITYTDPKWIQRYILTTFYFHFNGDSWRSCHRNDTICRSNADINSWLTNTDECTWLLLECDKTNTSGNNDDDDDGVGVLTKIDLVQGKSDAFVTTDTPLKGVLPSEIRYLTGLTYLSLPELELTGTVLPLLSEMSDLSLLLLKSNNFSGPIPDTFGNEHPNLDALNLRSNSFTGILPASLSSLSNLTTIECDKNKFSGPIPSSLATLTNLDTIDFRDNKLSGEIPLALYKDGIKVLALGGNIDIKGTIGTEIGLMADLEIFDVHETKMSGIIPETLYQLPKLKELFLQNASFSGELSSSIGNLNETLVKLYLDDNNFNGPIPSTLEKLTHLEEIRLYGTDVTGSIPQALCDRRGYEVGMVEVLLVNCTIECECCAADCKNR